MDELWEEELAESAEKEGEEAAKKKAFQDGESFGKVNGGIIGFDVGYALGLSESLIILADKMPDSSKTKRIVENSNKLRYGHFSTRSFLFLIQGSRCEAEDHASGK